MKKLLIISLYTLVNIQARSQHVDSTFRHYGKLALFCDSLTEIRKKEGVTEIFSFISLGFIQDGFIIYKNGANKIIKISYRYINGGIDVKKSSLNKKNTDFVNEYFSNSINPLENFDQTKKIEISEDFSMCFKSECKKKPLIQKCFMYSEYLANKESMAGEFIKTLSHL